MKLLDATAAACVEAWAAGRNPGWTPPQRRALCDSLLALSEAATPHVVADTVLDDADAQRFLLRRALDLVDDALTRAAAGMRRALRMDPVVRAADGAPALGLRCAGVDEIDALPGIGRACAEAIARAIARHGGMDRIERLDAVEGVGPAMLDTLRDRSYFDAPWSALVSPSLSAFCRVPSLPNALALFERTDLEVFHGDANRLRRLADGDGSVAARLLRLLDAVRGEARARRSPLSGTFASHGVRALRRDALRASYLDALEPTDGEVLVNAAYREAMIDVIAGAAARIDLVMFLATASRDPATGTGSADIIDALEARVAAGVAVRVIVDRDRPGDPYRSGAINAPLIARLRAAGASVKQDVRETLLHSKFLVVDRQRAIVGSHNLTTTSIARTHEVSVRLDAPAVAEAFARRFDALWAGLP